MLRMMVVVYFADAPSRRHHNVPYTMSGFRVSFLNRRSTETKTALGAGVRQADDVEQVDALGVARRNQHAFDQHLAAGPKISCRVRVLRGRELASMPRLEQPLDVEKIGDANQLKGLAP